MTLINQYISLPVYALIVSDDYSNYHVKCPTYNNDLIYISKPIVTKSASFNNKFSSTEKLNKHQLAEKLVFSNGTIFTVEFEKVDKTVRKLVGYLSSTDTLLGYSNVVDLELLVKENNLDKCKRVVYHSKLLSLIINDVKYELK